MKNSVVVHYHSNNGNYFDLNMWQWLEGHMGKDAFFSRFDSFGIVGNLSYESDQFQNHVYLIVKNADWSTRTPDFRINCDPGLTKREVWIVQGDDTLYYSRQAAVASHAYSQRQPHAFDPALNFQRFDHEWGFQGWLGFSYRKEATEFRLWAPTAKKVELIIYRSTDEKSSVLKVLKMKRGGRRAPDNHDENTHGVWSLTVDEDLNYHAYSYRVYYRRKTFRTTRDPYTIATTANGQRSIVIADADLTPAGFTVKQGKEAFWRLSNPAQAVITEMHIRDFSKSATSGVRQENRGKFLGAFEKGTKNAYGDKTTFDYLKDLGISYVQLQPVFDHHQSFNDDGSYAYNWGYDPENYNVPEASFSSNPHAPTARILELKQLIQAYHEAGIGVIMDVVYNHTYSSYDSAFQLAVPDYYYRMNSDGSFQNGSGCGNETASEKEMFRKYMIDSILYWIHAYNIDGFRFDLMGLHDVETMNAIRSAVDEVDPNILLYGEGWDMGTGLMPENKAKKENAFQMPRIGFFNDDARNAIKGAEVYGDFERGFVSGEAREDKIAKAFLGSDELAPYLRPTQVVNYVEAHDNYNLNDLLWVLNSKDSQDVHVQRVELATSLGILMQGVAFIELGQEFLRTKLFPTGPDGEITEEDRQRAMNSYNAPDEVNQVDWNNVTFYKSTVDFVRKLIALKTKEAVFSYQTFEDIRKHIYVESAEYGSGLVAATISSGSKTFKLIFNNRGKNSQIDMTAYENYDIILTNVKRLHKLKSQFEFLSATVFELKK
ncbi:type I pullulanase [Streptococcus macacae]|uniref:pullulanase n=1 Tax=Streptococcus macacae NCTC 11558 TaxID=764298 RepID=G5JWK1_9STRE|nr:type I pullulanase [Streptococcus macacae]EHJ51967.1 pullulanase, type I [Streptococcus macacae NCTC 11558]SUN78781.1 pullulanase [Streptococcus macacae NCTC 11558]